MAAFSNFAENKLIDWFFRAQAIGVTGATAAAGTGPATLWVGLMTTTPTDIAAGTEPTGGGYARQSVTSSLTAWSGTQGTNPTPDNTASSGTGGTTFNSTVITFPSPTASAYSAPVTYAGVWDAVSGGNLLFYSILGSPKTVNQNDAAPSFPIGSLTFQLDN